MPYKPYTYRYQKQTSPRALATKQCSRFLHIILAFLLCFAVAYPTNIAYSEVLKTDIIKGESVDALNTSAINCPNIGAQYAILVDSNGESYFERDADTPTQIASVTKIMTALVSLDYGSESDTITVSEDAAKIGESSASLHAGDKLSFKDCLFALMVPSGNDAALALAEYYGAKIIEKKGLDKSSITTVQAFVDVMNEKAQQLDMSNSVFSNPHGLDDGEYTGSLHSTARDVAKMSRYAMQNPTFRGLVNNEEVTINVDRGGASTPLTLKSTDELIGELDGICGIKTGYTDSAGACFAGCINRNGQEIYTVVLKSTDELSRFTDTTNLTEWYYKHCIDYKIANSSQTTESSIGGTTTSVPLIANIADNDYVDKVIPGVLRDSNMSIRVFDLNGNISQKFEPREVSGNVKAGDVIGQLIFLQHNSEIARVDIVAASDVNAPNPFEAIGISIDRFIRGITGQKTVADSELLNKTRILNDKTTSL